MGFAAIARPETVGKIPGRVEGQKPGAQNGQTCCVTSPWQHSGQSQRVSESIHYKVHKNTDNVQQPHESAEKPDRG